MTTGRPNCAECQNLKAGGWCNSLKRSVSGSRHIRKCSAFLYHSNNPKPVRKGKKPHIGLVQCTSCRYSIPWGFCEYGHSELARLELRIWRRCADFKEAKSNGSCDDCAHHFKSFCYLAEYPVTGKDKPISCCYFTQGKP